MGKGKDAKEERKKEGLLSSEDLEKEKEKNEKRKPKD